jgi:hypothetical protein
MAEPSDEKPKIIDWARIKTLAVDDCTLIVVYIDGEMDRLKFNNKAEMLKVLESRQTSSN